MRIADRALGVPGRVKILKISDFLEVITLEKSQHVSISNSNHTSPLLNKTTSNLLAHETTSWYTSMDQEGLFLMIKSCGVCNINGKVSRKVGIVFRRFCLDPIDQNKAKTGQIISSDHRVRSCLVFVSQRKLAHSARESPSAMKYCVLV